MDWNSTFQPFVSPPEPSLSFLCNYNHDQYPGVEMKHLRFADVDNGLVPAVNKSSNRDKKKLTREQSNCLERSFQEETTLDPDRKMKLSKELGLQPRQIAVWFQNRRARWKAKQLQHSYETLKQDYDAISKEKQKLLDEVMKLKGMLMELKGMLMELKGMLMEEAMRNQVSSKAMIAENHNHPNPIAECSNAFNVEEYYNFPVAVSSPAWDVQLPPYP